MNCHPHTSRADDRARTSLSRRRFLYVAGSGIVGASLTGCGGAGGLFGDRFDSVEAGDRIAPAGPGANYVPTLRVAFARRRGAYGMRWPGQIYDGKAALANYTEQIEATAERLGMNIDIRPEPIYSLEEGEAWAAEVKAAAPDGVLIVLLDRQEHAWPTAGEVIDAGLPTLVFAPIGAAFTTNTWKHADREGCLIHSTDDFEQVAFGMKMIRAGAKLREMRYIVLKGEERRDDRIAHLGTRLRYVPARTFLEEYNRTEMTADLKRGADAYIRRATRLAGATREDVYNGIKSYRVAQRILEREGGDAITMDCLGALGKSKVSLPCIAWSRMLDHGIPAACEADLEACATHALVLLLFDRPGFQQDPVPETSKTCIVGAHCSCPTRLRGLDQPPEPFYLSHHHGSRDAVPRTMWREGERVTVADVRLAPKSEGRPAMIISSGEVVDNVAVPPAGGCVVSVTVRLDGVTDVLGYPGFHQIFFYGDYRRQLADYCRLFKIAPQIV